MPRRSKSVTRREPPHVEKGRRIREARSAVRLSQRELGARLGVIGRTVLRWEAGEFAPPARVREALLAALVDAGTPLVDALASALGMDEHRAARAAAIEAALREAGEIADAKPSGIRAAIAHVLARAQEHGVGIAELAERVAPRRRKGQ
jgi:transcriptional regulator with XRE-family HTH domain